MNHRAAHVVHRNRGKHLRVHRIIEIDDHNAGSATQVAFLVLMRTFCPRVSRRRSRSRVLTSPPNQAFLIRCSKNISTRHPQRRDLRHLSASSPAEPLRRGGARQHLLLRYVDILRVEFTSQDRRRSDLKSLPPTLVSGVPRHATHFEESLK